MKKYTLIFMAETDGDIRIQSVTADELRNIVSALASDDYAIVDGNILKTFNNKIDLNLTGAQIGRVPLPTDSKSVQTVKNFIERRISGISGLNVDSLNFTNGKLHFKGTFPSKMSF